MTVKIVRRKNSKKIDYLWEPIAPPSPDHHIVEPDHDPDQVRDESYDPDDPRELIVRPQFFVDTVQQVLHGKAKEKARKNIKAKGMNMPQAEIEDELEKMRFGMMYLYDDGTLDADVPKGHKFSTEPPPAGSPEALRQENEELKRIVRQLADGAGIKTDL